MDKKKNKSPSIGGLIAKVAFGAMFIAIGIAPDPEFDAGGRSVAIIMGVAIIVWGFAKVLIWNKRRNDILEEIEREEQEIRSMKEALRNKPRKCPHCGATTKGTVCEYCGSALTESDK